MDVFHRHAQGRGGGGGEGEGTERGQNDLPKRGGAHTCAVHLFDLTQPMVTPREFCAKRRAEN